MASLPGQSRLASLFLITFLIMMPSFAEVHIRSRLRLPSPFKNKGQFFAGRLNVVPIFANHVNERALDDLGTLPAVEDADTVSYRPDLLFLKMEPEPLRASMRNEFCKVDRFSNKSSIEHGAALSGRAEPFLEDLRE